MLLLRWEEVDTELRGNPSQKTLSHVDCGADGGAIKPPLVLEEVSLES